MDRMCIVHEMTYSMTRYYCVADVEWKMVHFGALWVLYL